MTRGGVVREGSSSWAFAITPDGDASQYKEAYERRGDPDPVIVGPFVRAPLKVSAIRHCPLLV